MSKFQDLYDSIKLLKRIDGDKGQEFDFETASAEEIMILGGLQKKGHIEIVANGMNGVHSFRLTDKGKEVLNIEDWHNRVKAKPVIQKTTKGQIMRKYHKIQTLFKREREGRKKGKIIEGEWSIPEFEYLAKNRWEFSEKVDGTNVRIGWNGGERMIGGRTDNAQMPVVLYRKLEELFPEENLRRVFGTEEETNVVVFGEGYGPKIQKGGGNYRPDVSFVLFDVLVGDWWLKRSDVVDVAQKLGVDMVPVIGEGDLFAAVATVRAGFSSRWGDFDAEGLVVRPKAPLHARDGSRIIGKIKLKDFR